MLYLKKWNSFNEEENIESILGDLGDLGLIRNRAYIAFFEVGLSETKEIFRINFPDLDSKRGTITENDVLDSFSKKNFDLEMFHYKTMKTVFTSFLRDIKIEIHAPEKRSKLGIVMSKLISEYFINVSLFRYDDVIFKLIIDGKAEITSIQSRPRGIKPGEQNK